MAISAKGRRRIEVDGASYLWWIGQDDDSLGAITLTVVSSDKRFFVKYPLVAFDHRVVVLGPDFRDRTDCGRQWRRFRCPAFGSVEILAPGAVAALVRWCKTGSDELVEVDWQGNVRS